ncbi:MAG: hypothetical protein AAF270_10885 [Pseudomonadota bacterium]
MLKFFRLMVPVALLRRGPQDLPYSQSLCTTALVIAFVLSLMASALAQESLSATGGRFIVAMLFYALSVTLLLALYQLPNRLLQTLTAGFGVAAVFGVVDILLLLAQLGGLSESVRITGLLMLVAWSLLVDGHILSAALDIRLIAGCTLAIAIFVPQIALIAAISSGGAAN